MKIKESGKILREALVKVGELIEPGVNTKMLDDFIYKFIVSKNAYPVFLGYKGYPAASCISVNDEVIHGIPDEKIILNEGDIVDIDAGVKYNGYIADASITFPVGKVSPDAEKIMNVTYTALFNAIKQAVPGNRMGDIGFAIQSYAESFGYSVVKDYVGHGVGLELHEEPQVPNYGSPGKGLRLKSGMVIAIEPMIIASSSDEVFVKENGWTVVTADHSLSAHYEHTIAITDDGPMILTI